MSASNDKTNLITTDLQVWDDGLLIKAYDASINLAKEDLAKRIANATNSKSSAISDDQGASGGCELNDITIAKDEKQYNLGDYVRATYDDDIDYEAKIIKIDEINDMCTVKYIGYDNEQNVQLCTLIPSWGKKSRRMQFAKAKQSKDMNTKEKSHVKKSKLHKKQPNVLNLNSSYFQQLPPPPPLPPMLNELSEDSDHISAMLMSWYMSGYYTGLYQGQKLAKAPKPKNNKSKEK